MALRAENWRFVYSEASVMSDLFQNIQKPAKVGKN